MCSTVIALALVLQEKDASAKTNTSAPGSHRDVPRPRTLQHRQDAVHGTGLTLCRFGCAETVQNQPWCVRLWVLRLGTHREDAQDRFDEAVTLLQPRSRGAARGVHVR